MKPRPHQAAELAISQDLPTRALWWEMGLGKTFTCLRTAAHLHARSQIDAVLVLAPPTVHDAWITVETPQWLPEATSGLSWHSHKSNSKYWQAKAEETLVSDFPIVAMHYRQFMTDRGGEFAKRLLTTRRCLYIADEGSAIKTPGAKVTRRTLASAKLAPFRRILNGTPAFDSPFELFTQIKFLEPTFWADRGIRNYTQFRYRYGIFKQGHFGPEIVDYQNLEELSTYFDEVGSRCLKEDVLDLPPKIYKKAYFDLTPTHRRIYNDLKENLEVETERGLVTADQPLVRMTRFRQITSNYFPNDDLDPELTPIAKLNPRIVALQDILETIPQTTSVIIFANFNADIDSIMGILDSAVRFDGKVNEDEKAEAVRKFQAKESRFFVAKPQAAARGLNLTAASVVIYYNNHWSVDLRAQSEDRAHRIGTTSPVVYYDIVARDTIDEGILGSLRKKRKTSTIITKDQLFEWI